VPENIIDSNNKSNYFTIAVKYILDGEKLQPRHVQYIGYLQKKRFVYQYESGRTMFVFGPNERFIKSRSDRNS
jgi:hypothetical protein